MSITDELRQVAAKTETASGRCERLYRGDLERIADRIDEAHKHAIAYVDDRDPETMAEHGWIKLPVDADGVPIHVGDKMEFCAFDIEHPVIRTVDGLGKDVFFAWCGERGYQQHDAKRYRHYTPPTVEDVLEQFVARWMDTHHDDLPALKAEYAAKLRLAEEDA